MSRESRAVDAVTGAALTAFSAPASHDHLAVFLGVVQQSVGADTAGFYIHEWRGWTTPVCITPDDAWRLIPFGRLPTGQVAALHPGIRHCVRTGTQTPFAVTDVVTERAWRQSELGRQMRPDWGRNYQFAIPTVMTSPQAESHVWVFGRRSSNFTRSDRDVAHALSPVLNAVAKHRHAVNALNVKASVGGLLTPREVAVLAVQSEGLGSRGIALRLGMSPRTAQKHSEHIYRKLGVHNQHEAVRMCQMLGISPATDATPP